MEKNNKAEQKKKKGKNGVFSAPYAYHSLFILLMRSSKTAGGDTPPSVVVLPPSFIFF
jgi:hypothetical protein